MAWTSPPSAACQLISKVRPSGKSHVAVDAKVLNIAKEEGNAATLP